MKKHLFIWISGLLAFLFTLYTALDTFVIVRVYTPVAVATSASAALSASESHAENSVSGTSEVSNSSGASTASETVPVIITENSYQDANINITLTTYREYDTDIYVADIHLSSPEYLKTALAKGAYGKNVIATTSEIAESVGAILAINGDYYGVQESGYVLRNGVLYRNTAKSNQEDLVIYQDGSMEIITESDVSAETLLEKGAVQILCFGPGLLKDSQISVTTSQEVAKAAASNPRTAIGFSDDDPLHYVFAVADGRTSLSAGLSLYELAEFMQSLGIPNAYNLDGGGSSTMVFEGTVINQPVSSSGKTKEGSERGVSDIVYIGY